MIKSLMIKDLHNNSINITIYCNDRMVMVMVYYYIQFDECAYDNAILSSAVH